MGLFQHFWPFITSLDLTPWRSWFTPGHGGTRSGWKEESPPCHHKVPDKCPHLEREKKKNLSQTTNPFQSQLLFKNPRSQVFQGARQEVHREALIIRATIIWSNPTVWMDFSRFSVKLLNGSWGYLLYFLIYLFTLLCNTSEWDQSAQEPPWSSRSPAFCEWSIVIPNSNSLNGKKNCCTLFNESSFHLEVSKCCIFKISKHTLQFH